MPRTNPAAELAGRLIDELTAAQVRGEYPIPLNRLVERIEPPADPAVLAKALAHKQFTSRAVVALKGRPDSPVTLIEDRDRLAEAPHVLEVALRALGEISIPPWPLSK